MSPLSLPTENSRLLAGASNVARTEPEILVMSSITFTTIGLGLAALSVYKIEQIESDMMRVVAAGCTLILLFCWLLVALRMERRRAARQALERYQEARQATSSRTRSIPPSYADERGARR